MKRVARPGDSVLKHITASQINEWNKRKPQYQPQRKATTENPTKVMARVDTDDGPTIQRFEPVNIVEPFVVTTGTVKDGMWETAAVRVNTTLTEGKWGISQGLIRPNMTDYVVVSGLTWAKFDYIPGDTHVKVENGELVSSNSGEATIIYPPPEEGMPGLILIRGGAGTSTTETKIVQGRLIDLYDGEGEATGYKVGVVQVIKANCAAEEYIGQEIHVVDWSECVFDLDFADLEDVWVWAVDDYNIDPPYGDGPYYCTPYYDPYYPECDCGWATLDRCCVDADTGGTGSSGSGSNFESF